MKTAALVIAAGLPKYEGLSAAMYKVGAVSSAQHVIATFQKAGISPIFLVTDEVTKRLEKLLSSSSVLFMRNEGSSLDCAKAALVSLPRHYDRIIICTADRPMIMPETISALAKSSGDIVQPCYKGKEAPLCLLSMDAAEELCAETTARTLSAALTKLGFEKHSPEFSDSGLLCTPRKALADEALMEKHQNSLVRPQIEIAVSGEHNIFDGRLIKLLCQVELLRSVRAACEMCGMSYSIAWNLLNAAEDRLGYPLVSRNQGGRSGSGTELTEKGKRMLNSYLGFEAAMQKKVEELYQECFEGLI